MKLYATVTSERASKGQGGNKHLKTEFYTGSSEDSNIALDVTMKVFDNEVGLLVFDHESGQIVFSRKIQLKGNKQKDETSMCMNCRTMTRTDNMGTCSICTHDK